MLSLLDSPPLAPGFAASGRATGAAMAAVIPLCARVATPAGSGKMGRLGREAGPSRRAAVPFRPAWVSRPPAQ
jgi:hypothetical protein